MRMAMRAAAVASGLLVGACSVVGIREAEEPHFKVITNVGPVQFRQYDARVAAETTVDSDEESARGAGFRRLAGYIFGGNQKKTSIDMTAPVAQQAGSQSIDMTAPVAQTRDAEGRWTIRFFMPAKWTLDTLPTPNDAAVKLVAVPPQTMAVLRFSGSTGPQAVATEKAALTAGLAGSGWHETGPSVAWFYDPPWTLPFLRRNEVAVPVAKVAT